MGARVASSIILLIALAALIWFGLGFAGYAIWAGLTPAVGEAAAAAIAAFALLLVPIIALVVLAMRRPPRVENEGAAIAIFAAIARSKPLMAVAGAALVALAEIFLKKRK
jgi:hypothetical protein